MKHNNIIDMYSKAFQENGDSPKGVMWPKGQQDLRFSNLLQHINSTRPFSLLDYGCGLGHMSDFIQEKYPLCSYSGADVNHDFIKHCSQKYQNRSFLHINDFNDIQLDYDHIVASGVFNILYGVDDQFTYIKAALKHLYQQCQKSLSVNFLSPYVDFKQDVAYHQDITSLLTFIVQDLSKCYILNHSYMPYEYTVTIYKNPKITPNVNVYTAGE